MNSIQSVVHISLETGARAVIGKGWRRTCGRERGRVIPPLESLLKTLSDQWGAGWWGVGFRAKLPSYLYNNAHVYVSSSYRFENFFILF